MKVKTEYEQNANELKEQSRLTVAKVSTILGHTDISQEDRNKIMNIVHHLIDSCVKGKAIGTAFLMCMDMVDLPEDVCGTLIHEMMNFVSNSKLDWSEENE